MRPSLRRALDWWARNRHPLLFALLIATIAIGPLLSIIGSGGWLLDTCLGLTLLVAAIMPMRDRVGGRGFIAFVIAAVIVGLLPNRTPLGDVGPFTMIVWAGIAFFAAARALRYAVSSTQVDTHHLIAALNAYLLVGVFFGAIWVALEEAMPRAMLLGGQPMVAMALPDGIYFSFVTLATLGYGDITPATPIARGLAVFEAIFGQLYLAIMVARLVSLRINTQSSREGPP